MINYSKNNQKGSVMIEALAMLGLIAMVTPMLYRKAAERTTELQDINIASQIRMVSAAVDSYLKDNYTQLAGRGNTFQIKGGDGATATEQSDYNGVSAYLPEGFDLEHASKLFEGFEIAVRKDTATDLEGNTRNVFTSAVVANLKDDMTKVRAAKIASMIGTNGGMVSMEGESGSDYWLNGTQGTWRTQPNSFGFGDNPGWRDNSLVSISSEAISSSNGDVGSDEALFRVWKGESGFNTMEASLLFGGGNNVALDMRGHDIRGVDTVIASGTTITVSGNLALGDNHDITSVRNITATGTIGASAFSGQTFSGGTFQGGTFQGGTFSGEAFVGGSFSGTTVYGTTGTFTTSVSAPAISGTTSVYGEKINAGSGGINTSGDITMNNNDITGIAGNINITGNSGLSMAGNPINMGGGDITNVGRIDGTTADFDNIIATSIGASAISSMVGTFDDLHAKNYLTVGGNTHNQGTVLEVKTNNSGTALFKTNQFGVGASNADNYNSNNNNIVIDNDVTFVGRGYNVTNDGMKVTADSLNINKSYNGGASNSTIDMSSNKIKIYNSAGMGVVSDSAGFMFTDVATAGVNFNSLSEIETPVSADPGVLATHHGEGIAAFISRRGVLELASPDSGEGKESGYIRARRLVSDIPYTPDQWGGDGWSGDYPYYEVNPAYTSVMNDIKLASRGGARLSDILPDYINKGIYIADNTYREGFVWTDGDVGRPNDEVQTEAEAGGECNNCPTSPWLGFVPAPMCPPGYFSVVTLEPIRWKMAEVYAFANSNYNGSGDDLINNFDNVYFHPTGGDWPGNDEFDKRAPYVNVNVTEAGDGTHTATAEIKGVHPVVLQTNTWLSTTIVESNSGNKNGWHTIMGFLYPKDEYANMYQRLNGRAPAEDMWNLFPVYPQEMAAVARVYCSFLRHDDGSWTWGENNSPVLQYDQLDDNTYAQSKDTDWISQVNDPDLGYSSEW